MKSKRRGPAINAHHWTPAEVRDERIQLAQDMLSLVIQDGADLPKALRKALTRMQAELAELREALAMPLPGGLS